MMKKEAKSASEGSQTKDMCLMRNAFARAIEQQEQ
jgi:hypothetical protein